MDFLYPCSLCSETFPSRKHIIRHIQTQHPNSLPKTFIDSESFYCSSCYKQFNNKSLLKQHIRMKHKTSAFFVMMSSLYNISFSEPSVCATKDGQNQIKPNECSWSLDDCLFLKKLLPDGYNYRLLDYKKLLHEHFKAKFEVNGLSKTSFPNWLNTLCTKTKVLYDVKPSQNNLRSNSYYKVFRCKCDDYWNLQTKAPFVNQTRCNSSLTVLIKNPNVNLNNQTKAVILMKHCHFHPLNQSNKFNSVRCKYDQLSRMLSQGSTTAAVMHQYKTQTLCNKSKYHFFKSAVFGTKPDAEFIFDLYYMINNEATFISPLAKYLNSLLEMVKYYNNINSAECALVNFVDNAIVVTVRTPAMKQKSDKVFVCSTNCHDCKTWFMLSLCDNGGTVPVGVMIATKETESVLKTGFDSWKQLGGTVNTILVELDYLVIFQSIFPIGVNVCISTCHLLLDIWKCLFSILKKNLESNEIECFINSKSLIYPKTVLDASLISKITNCLTKKYSSNFKHQTCDKLFKINDTVDLLSMFNPCTIFERKLIYDLTKSLSIIQMFYFIIDEIDLLYDNTFIKSPKNIKLVNELFKNEECKNNFTYCRVKNITSMFLVKCQNNETYFIDTDIGACSCCGVNMCTPCCHQVYLNDNEKNSSPGTDSVFRNLNNLDLDTDSKKREFDKHLLEFSSIFSNIRKQLVTNPEYFKSGIQSFVSSFKKQNISNVSLSFACHSLAKNPFSNNE